MYSVAPGVHRIPLSLPDDGLRAVNTYVIDDGPGITLVDPGQYGPLAREELAAGLALLGRTFADVRRCLTTHVHRDHYTNAVALRREFGCPVSLGVGERASLRAVRVSDTYGIDPQLRALPLCGAGFLVAELDPNTAGHGLPKDIWEDPDEWLSDGDSVRLESRTLRVMRTPGHTSGHVTYHDVSAGLLFSGDHVLPRITPSIGFEPAATDLPLASFLDSLARTAAAPDAALVAAHGPVTASVRERVAELQAHHQRRLELTGDEVRGGARSVYEVAGGLGWTRRLHPLETLDPFNRMLAVMETKAHLDVLVRDGVVERDLAGGVFVYSPRIVEHEG
ncbi:MAG TPA: MBL fold metallo-hydrolase [Pseudonocardiaceae bacterium]|nr:MBL fold metallo-hydrolase [Pseudonocardiaceae bacterium]